MNLDVSSNISQCSGIFLAEMRLCIIARCRVTLSEYGMVSKAVCPKWVLIQINDLIFSGPFILQVMQHRCHHAIRVNRATFVEELVHQFVRIHK